MSRILVTGSEGFIGSRLCSALEALGHEVFHEILHVDSKIGISIAESNYENIDVVYHLAAQTDIKRSVAYPLQDAANNIIETIRLIGKYPDTKIIYAATASSLHITSPYALSKKTAAEYIKLLCKKHVICMLPNIWGPGGRGAINTWQAADVIKIFGDGHHTRSIVHVDDVVKGFIKALEWPTGEYMLGGTVLSLKEIAERIAGTEKQIEYIPEYTGDIFAEIIPNTTPDWQAEIQL